MCDYVKVQKKKKKKSPERTIIGGVLDLVFSQKKNDTLVRILQKESVDKRKLAELNLGEVGGQKRHGCRQPSWMTNVSRGMREEGGASSDHCRQLSTKMKVAARNERIFGYKLALCPLKLPTPALYFTFVTPVSPESCKMSPMCHTRAPCVPCPKP